MRMSQTEKVLLHGSLLCLNLSCKVSRTAHTISNIQFRVGYAARRHQSFCILLLILMRR